MMSMSSQWTFIQLFHYFWPRILFAILCGGVIGLERELKNKPAGLKTNILICLGSALYTSVSVLITSGVPDNHPGDPGRIAAQIVSGIGFLGGGAIIQARGTVVGLTTAATIWVVAAIGICIGIGHSDIAIVTSVSVVIVLVGTTLFEDRILGRSLSFACEILIDDPKGHIRTIINQAFSQNSLSLEDFNISSKGEHSLLSCKYSGHRNDHKKFILDLWEISGVREVRQI